MFGYGTLAEPQGDLAPERAAARLRELKESQAQETYANLARSGQHLYGIR